MYHAAETCANGALGGFLSLLHSGLDKVMSNYTRHKRGVCQNLRTSNLAAKPTCHSLMVSRGANNCFFSSSDIGAASMKPRCRSCKESA